MTSRNTPLLASPNRRKTRPGLPGGSRTADRSDAGTSPQAGASQRQTQAGSTLSGSNSCRTWPNTRRRSGTTERVN